MHRHGAGRAGSCRVGTRGGAGLNGTGAERGEGLGRERGGEACAGRSAAWSYAVSRDQVGVVPVTWHNARYRGIGGV